MVLLYQNYSNLFFYKKCFLQKAIQNTEEAEFKHISVKSNESKILLFGKFIQSSLKYQN